MVTEVQGCFPVLLAAQFAVHLAQRTFNPVSGYNSNERLSGTVFMPVAGSGLNVNGPAKPKIALYAPHLLVTHSDIRNVGIIVLSYVSPPQVLIRSDADKVGILGGP
jgi:hypothetical protein